ncbi:nucleotide-diphospho-sugar transferase [Podospora appendiculata]|uniref:Mannose-1-phosphate guanyltransferase n=1 Tax=Podospora appendiculata TaxID=314037 RepID=A0AAE0XCZ5_9PEZI|nr:nucleotide-diphospho-sugar transferase [Podospora appendiculata]
MSKQASKGAAAGKAKKPTKAGAEEKREDVLQAVVLADSFQDRFRPFSLEKPRCLLPLANVPLIEYTLEFLASNGVQDVFIYCGAHSEVIEDYIHNSMRWNPAHGISPFASVEFIRVSDATSTGDFLRDLDGRNLISGDFILVHGDVVANVSLDAALAKHRARREANRDACMTMVLREIGDQPHRAARTRVITPVFVVEPSTGRCLQYEEMHPLQSDPYTILDPAIFSYPEFEVRSDLIDCGIDICTPEVLALWSESFDYELPRKNFLHGVLKDFELNGKVIYTEILEDGYAARANTLRMYDCISKDILGRWTFPYVPDSNMVHDQAYKRAREGSCIEEGVKLAKDSKVTKSVIGRRSTAGAGATIARSIIGRRCKIGKNVKIENSYIWDDTTVGDGSSIVNSILADSVIIGKDCIIPEGSLISYGVHISDGTHLPTTPASRISLLTQDGKLASTDTSLVGKSGSGAFYKETIGDDIDSDDDDDEVDPSALDGSLFYTHPTLNISSESISTLASHSSFDSDDEDQPTSGFLQPGSSNTRNRLSSFASNDSEAAAAAEKSDAFHGDAVHGLVDALRNADSDDFDSAKLEFMGLRLANDASDGMMRWAIAEAFVSRASELLSPENGGLDSKKAAEAAFTEKKGAVKFIKEVGVGSEKETVQAEFALAMQKSLLDVKGLEGSKAGRLLAAMLQQLYILDVLEEEGILEWWGNSRAAETESLRVVRGECRDLIKWLEEAEEEESEDESEAEDSD